MWHVAFHSSTKQSILLCAKCWQPYPKRFLFLISLNTSLSSQKDPITALTAYSIRSSTVYIGIQLCMWPSTADLLGNLSSFSFIYTKSKNLRSSGTFLEITNFPEISHPCCGTDYRVLEEKESKEGTVVCWAQALVKFLVKGCVGRTQSRKLWHQKRWGCWTRCYNLWRVQTLRVKGRMITANIRTTTIPLRVDLLWVCLTRHLLLVHSRKALQDCNLPLQKQGLSCVTKLSQITVFTQRVLDSLDKQDFIIWSRVAERAPGLIICGI